MEKLDSDLNILSLANLEIKFKFVFGDFLFCPLPFSYLCQFSLAPSLIGESLVLEADKHLNLNSSSLSDFLSSTLMSPFLNSME